VTRAYFHGEKLNETDPLLMSIEEPARRATLIARPAGAAVWRMDVRLQGGDGVPGCVGGQPNNDGATFQKLRILPHGQARAGFQEFITLHARRAFSRADLSGGHVHKAVEAEQLDLPAHEVGHARLRHAEHLGSLALAQFLAGNVILEGHHQLGSKSQVLRRDLCVLDRTPHATEAFVANRFNSFAKSL
jgi:hypothetical protein